MINEFHTERMERIIALIQDDPRQVLLRDNLVWMLPSRLKLKYLEEFGFTSSQAGEIILAKNNVTNSKWAKLLREFNFNSKDFVSVLRRRLAILRDQGTKLGIIDHIQQYENMFLWDKLIRAVDKMYQIQVPLDPALEPGNGTRRYLNNAPKMLSKYFGYETIEEKSRLMKDINKLPNARDVPLRVVIESIKLLEEERFSKSQIRRAVQLLYYSHKIIKDQLDRIEVDNLMKV